MNTQHSNDANRSKTESEKKAEAARPTPGKDDKHESHEPGKVRAVGPNERKGNDSK